MPEPETPSAASATSFFSSGLRARIDQLMNLMWAGGVNNPMDSIEQISYLIFLRLLSERDDQAAAVEQNYSRTFSGEWSRLAWGNFVTLTGAELFDSLRAAIERLHELPGLSPTGRELFRNATLKIYDRATLRAVVQGVAELDLSSHGGKDVKGDMYEYLLGKLSQSGTNGQFRTPRHIINMMVRLIDPKPHERVCDPACGTAGFLVASYLHMLRSATHPADLERGIIDGSLLNSREWDFIEAEAFTGFDNDANMVKLSIMNLYLHELERARVEHRNPLTTAIDGQYPGRRYDVILANPPFAGRVQKESILTDLNLDTRDTELLFMKWFIDHLTDDGRSAVIVPNGVLFGSNRANRKVRELLVDECNLQAVISLPSGVFKPYSAVSTAILVFERGGRTEDVWFYDLRGDGLTLDDRRTPGALDDIPDLLARWPERSPGENCSRVPAETIRAEGYQLLSSRYRDAAAEMSDDIDPRSVLRAFIAAESSIVAEAESLLRLIDE